MHTTASAALKESRLHYYRRLLASILAILIVMGCAGITAFRTSGEQTVYTAVAYYSAVDADSSFIGAVIDGVRAVFSAKESSVIGSYIRAQSSSFGEYLALVFDGQIITAPQLRADLSDGSAQIAMFSYVQPVKFIDSAKQRALPAPLQLTTKEKVELLM